MTLVLLVNPKKLSTSLTSLMIWSLARTIKRKTTMTWISTSWMELNFQEPKKEETKEKILMTIKMTKGKIAALSTEIKIGILIVTTIETSIAITTGKETLTVLIIETKIVIRTEIKISPETIIVTKIVDKIKIMILIKIIDLKKIMTADLEMTVDLTMIEDFKTEALMMKKDLTKETMKTALTVDKTVDSTTMTEMTTMIAMIEETTVVIEMKEGEVSNLTSMSPTFWMMNLNKLSLLLKIAISKSLIKNATS